MREDAYSVVGNRLGNAHLHKISVDFLGRTLLHLYDKYKIVFNIK